MTREQLFDSLQYLDDDLIAQEQTAVKKTAAWKRWGYTAACLALLAGAALFIYRGPASRNAVEETSAKGEAAQIAGRPVQPVGIPGSAAESNFAMEPVPGGVPGTNGAVIPAERPPVPDILAWNDVEESPAQADWALKQGVCMVAEKLTKEQLNECMPEILLPWMQYAEGYATYLLYDGSGGLAYVELKVTDPDWGGTTTIRIRDKDAWQAPVCGVGTDENEIASSWNGLEYRAFRHRYFYGEGDPKEDPPQPWVELSVKFEKENLEYTLLTNVPQAEEDSAALDLRDLLLAYSGTHSVPDLSAFQCGEYRHLDEELTFAEALTDPDYGAYLPQTAPEGFDEGYFRRYQLGAVGETLSEDWLTAQWYGVGESRMLAWFAGQAGEEDRARVVGAEEREKYDFSLYPAKDWYYTVAPENRTTMLKPVFRAAELTPELVSARAHIDYGDKVLLDFCVLFDNGVLVTINSRGVSPEWVFDALNKIEA